MSLKKYAEAEIGKEYDFDMAGVLSGICKITGLTEFDDSVFQNHIYSANLVSVKSGDRKYWTGGILCSELR